MSNKNEKINYELLDGKIISSPSVILAKITSPEDKEKLFNSSNNSKIFNIICTSTSEGSSLFDDYECEIGDISFHNVNHDNDDTNYEEWNVNFYTKIYDYDSVSTEAFIHCFTSLLETIKYKMAVKTDDNILIYNNENENHLYSYDGIYNSKINTFIPAIKTAIKDSWDDSYKLNIILDYNHPALIDDISEIGKEKKKDKKKKKNKKKKNKK